eukprot:TRINITY_DN66967_c12_g5_i1.p1 TRINITY_DN66967_c12_g5~~TRINITY_DN66967_c12_g5_i1.p1  ORF type:complete len:264 (+),score=165.67 TRINITY_DN66967_c12_g5_i1:2-793(+)
MDPEECEEEQELEVEALQSIFEDDFEVLATKPNRVLQLRVAPNTGDGDDNHVVALVKVTLPAKYPEVVPDIQIIKEKGLVNKQIKILAKLANEAAEENVGEVSVFSISEAVKEWLADHNTPPSGSADDDDGFSLDGSGAGDDDDAQADYVPLVPPGTITTPESFMEWKKLFDEEQAKLRGADAEDDEKKDAETAKKGKLTGKQIFQLELAKEVAGSAGGKADAGAGSGQVDADGNEVFWFNDDIYDDEDLPDEEEEEDVVDSQ